MTCAGKDGTSMFCKIFFFFFILKVKNNDSNSNKNYYI